ncbi:MAG: amino acid ABC transporter permease [Coriobacteriia bacterium]|nr:amino acid ABC transporter permease [Coriobacteriia bacterium]MBN2823626.1 amino acid ABC transporter permease [Coriobacteriia bacterium]
MNPKLRRILWYAVNAVVWVTLAILLLTMVGPERFVYQTPAKRGQTGMVDKTYIISPTKDAVTIGTRANVLIPQAELDVDFGATLDRQPAGANAADSTWQLTAEETSPTPVLLNGELLTGNPVVEAGDIITVGGVEVTFDGSRRGILGAIDWWESGKVSHLFASPAVMSEAFPIVLKAFPVSLYTVIISFLLAIPGGLALAFMKMAKTRWARWPATIYVDVVRGTPIFLQILLVFFGLPLMPPWQLLVSAFPQLNESGLFGVVNSLYLRAFVVLSFNSAAYMAEIFRAGIQSINKGQMEAARSLGMTTPQAMTYVIIPQTIRRILPTMMSEFILLFKDTSLFSAVGLTEIVMRSREVASSTLNVSPYLLAAGFYLVLTIPLGRFVQHFENRLAKAEGGGGAVESDKADDALVDQTTGIPIPTRDER